MSSHYNARALMTAHGLLLWYNPVVPEQRLLQNLRWLKNRRGLPMPYPQFERAQLRFHPLAERQNKVRVEQDFVDPARSPAHLDAAGLATVKATADRVRAARAAGKPVMLTFGAHAIKNGLGPVIIRLLDGGWLQHLATNGAGIIHDWEFAFQGQSSEDVRANVAHGAFGMWQETGFHLNLALVLGAHDGLGYGEAVGRLIHTGKHVVPSREALLAEIAHAADSATAAEQAAAAADLLAVLERSRLTPGEQIVPHPWAATSVQAAAYRLKIPFTAHPMFGHDIIYEHPLNTGAAIGRAAERDFLTFAATVARLDGGVYLSVGSAVMSPMIFEKSMSMGQNLALQAGRRIANHFILVVDLTPSRWDWNTGEPPQDRPEYYLRYCKSFSRMGGTMQYLAADNRDFLLALTHELCG